jgi:hypothetical protein
MRIAGLALLLWCCAEPGEPIYRYVDDRGHVAFVTGLSRVPAKHRSGAEIVEQSADRGGPALDAGADASAGDPDLADGNLVYRYSGPAGRPVFTNRRELVPPAERSRLQVVDLSHVSTNPALGHDLDRALDREMERLAASAPCRQARAAGDDDAWTVLWRDQRHLVVVGVMLAAFLLVTPWAVRRLGAPWIRVLTFAIPTLLLTGLVAHAAIEVNRSLSDSSDLRTLCTPKDTDREGATDPAQIQARVQQTDALRSAVESALTAQDARIQQELAH